MSRYLPGALAVVLVACSTPSPDERTGPDAACIANEPCDGAGCPALEPYAQPCEEVPDSCPLPYACTFVEDDLGVRSVCLIACDSACDCPSPCVCKGVNGNTSWGPDGYCICV
jgi:hypothetical protein